MKEHFILMPLVGLCVTACASAGKSGEELIGAVIQDVATIGLVSTTVGGYAAREVVIDGPHADEVRTGVGVGVAVAAVVAAVGSSSGGGSAGPSRLSQDNFIEHWDQLQQQTAQGDGPMLDILVDGYAEDKVTLVAKMREEANFAQIFQKNREKGWAYLMQLASRY